MTSNNLKYSIKELQKAKTLWINLPDDDFAPVDSFLKFLETNPLKKRSLIPKGGNDCIMTPPELARRIVDHFSSAFLNGDKFLEPCKGEGAFVSAIEKHSYLFEEGTGFVDWCELSERIDFLAKDFGGKNYDWVITNPPFSKLRAFLKKSMELADNIIFLCPVNHILGLKARKRDINEAGFFVREVCRVDKPIEWPSSGFEYAAIYLSRQAGDCKFSNL